MYIMLCYPLANIVVVLLFRNIHHTIIAFKTYVFLKIQTPYYFLVLEPLLF